MGMKVRFLNQIFDKLHDLSSRKPAVAVAIFRLKFLRENIITEMASNGRLVNTKSLRNHSLTLTFRRK